MGLRALGVNDQDASIFAGLAGMATGGIIASGQAGPSVRGAYGWVGSSLWSRLFGPKVVKLGDTTGRIRYAHDPYVHVLDGTVDIVAHGADNIGLSQRQIAKMVSDVGKNFPRATNFRAIVCYGECSGQALADALAARQGVPVTVRGVDAKVYRSGTFVPGGEGTLPTSGYWSVFVGTP
jgi:hypothetical protein